MNKKWIYGALVLLTMSISSCSSKPAEKEENKAEWNIGKTNESDVKAEYKDEVILRTEHIGVAIVVERIEIIERGEHETRQEDDIQLEACL